MSDTEAEAWYQRHPDRLAWEHDEFARHALGIESSIDDQQRLVIKTELPFQGEPISVVVTFPHGYPFFPPTVTSTTLLLDRHQDPIGLNFCLLEDPERDWHPARSAGELVGRNLRTLLRDSAAGTVHAGEADMVEPVAVQFLCDNQDVVLVAEPFLECTLTARHGAMKVAKGVGRERMLIAADGIGEADRALVERYSKKDMSPPGRWVALDAPPRPQDFPSGILDAVRAADPTILTRLEGRLRGRRALRSASVLVGLTFLEEGPVRGEQRRNWLFVDIQQKRGYQPTLGGPPLAAQALSQNERDRRLPHLAGLHLARVVVVGAGSVGAPVALELAKAGVGRLDLLDNDLHDVNNAVRHVLGAGHGGEPKAPAVASLCQELNPFVDAQGHAVALGNDSAAHELLDALLEDATLIVDTTGAETVGRFLCERARHAVVPLIVSGLTAGSFGADVLVIEPEGPCLDCFILSQEDGAMPSPPSGPRSIVTPIGCRHPAFAGAGFEATELAAITARLAVRTTGLTEYPSSEVNWVVLCFRGGPHYLDGRIGVHPTCGGHD